MDKALFSFYGRLERLPFLGGAAMVLVVGFVLYAGVLRGGHAVIPYVGPIAFPNLRPYLGPDIVFLFSLSAACALLAWWTLALTVKRIRDTGNKPMMLIAVVLMLAGFDVQVVTGLTELRMMPPLQAFTPLGAFVLIGFILFLVAGPSIPDTETAEPTDPLTRIDLTAAPPVPRKPAKVAMRQEFGLRQR